MTSDQTRGGPKVPTEHPDPQAAARAPKSGSDDRPGFDLGGAEDTSGAGALQNPRTGVADGNAATGRATGVSDPSGSRSLGQAGEPGSASGAGPTDGSSKPH